MYKVRYTMEIPLRGVLTQKTTSLNQKKKLKSVPPQYQNFRRWYNFTLGNKNDQISDSVELPESERGAQFLSQIVVPSSWVR